MSASLPAVFRGNRRAARITAVGMALAITGAIASLGAWVVLAWKGARHEQATMTTQLQADWSVLASRERVAAARQTITSSSLWAMTMRVPSRNAAQLRLQTDVSEWLRTVQARVAMTPSGLPQSPLSSQRVESTPSSGVAGVRLVPISTTAIFSTSMEGLVAFLMLVDNDPRHMAVRRLHIVSPPLQSARENPPLTVEVTLEGVLDPRPPTVDGQKTTAATERAT